MDADQIPSGTVVFTSVGRPNYGFDVFSVNLSSSSPFHESRLTDGISINYNAHFIDDHQTIVFISERSGSSRVYLTRPGLPKPEPLPNVPTSLFHDRPVIRNQTLFFISAHQQPDKPFKSWSALYSTDSCLKLKPEEDSVFMRLTPYGEADFSPSVSQSGKYLAVASYGSGPWAGDFHELQTDIIVFEAANPSKRTVLCRHGGWPTWQGDSTVFFHRQDEDGWWSIFRADLTENFEIAASPSRVTPPGVHAFTPSASHDGRKIAVATRRKGIQFRHIELYDLATNEFTPVTQVLNPSFHHYNPFFSPGSGYLGYHRFRGESAQGELTVPHLEPVQSPATGPRKFSFLDRSGLRMLRINGSFPSFSPTGDLIALNHEFGPKGGLKIVKSNGSKRWTVLKDQTAFYNSWSPTEKNVIYTSTGPIFESTKATVQIARVEFDGSDLREDVDEVSANVKVLTKEETGNNAFPSVSPDGKCIVFRSGRSGFKNLYIMDSVHGEFKGEIRQLTFGDCIDTMPNWSPKGDLIAFSSNRHNPNNASAFSIYVIQPDGSGLKRIYLAGGKGSKEPDQERINHVCFSNDGKWLLFACNLGGVTVEPVSLPNQFQPYGELYIARLDGSGLTRLTWNGYENGTPTWRTGDDDVDFDEKLSLGDDVVGDKLKGDFEEPLWITCDF